MEVFIGGWGRNTSTQMTHREKDSEWVLGSPNIQAPLGSGILKSLKDGSLLIFGLVSLKKYSKVDWPPSFM